MSCFMNELLGGDHPVLHQSHQTCIANVDVRYPSSGHHFEARITVLALCLVECLLELCFQSL